MPVPKPCPCSSGVRYSACCGPFHKGLAAPPDAVALMRSRYAAFALGNAGYLWETLHTDHPDRARPEAEVVLELRDAAQAYRYTGLRILGSEPADASGTAHVTFHALMYRQGKERSFAERSAFRQEAGRWRYLSGEPFPTPA